MKRVLLIASFIGLIMVTTLDLQARHRRNILPQHARNGISFGLFRHIPLLAHHNRYVRYQDHQGRQVAREIRRNEKRIWKLEKRMDRLYRREGNYRDIRELKQEINWLERRNDYLRSQLY